MFSRIHDKLGSAGLIVAIIALVFAMVGGAYAASDDNSGATVSAKKSKKKKKSKGVTPAQVRKIAKQEAKKFANSNPGPQGPQGVPGAQGAKGDKGDTGSKGDDGEDGATGKSVEVVNESAPGCPGEEGVIYEVEGSGTETEVCNGEEGATGPTGPTGSPWTVGGMLPEGVTETGVLGGSCVCCA